MQPCSPELFLEDYGIETGDTVTQSPDYTDPKPTEERMDGKDTQTQRLRGERHSFVHLLTSLKDKRVCQ